MLQACFECSTENLSSRKSALDVVVVVEEEEEE